MATMDEPLSHEPADASSSPRDPVDEAIRLHDLALEAHSQQAQHQVDLFAPPPTAAEPEPSALDRALAHIDPDTLSPREALELVYTLKKLSTKT